MQTSTPVRFYMAYAPWILYLFVLYMEVPKLPIMYRDYTHDRPYYGFSSWMVPIQEIYRSNSSIPSLMFHVIVALLYTFILIWRMAPLVRLETTKGVSTILMYIVDFGFAISVAINMTRFGQTSALFATVLNTTLLLLYLASCIWMPSGTLSVLLTAIFLEAFMRSIGLLLLFSLLWIPHQIMARTVSK